MSALTLLVLVYLAGVLWFGLSGAKHAENSRTFLTNGGTTGVLFCALSLVSTILGGSATLGMGSLAQKTGSAAFWWLGVGAVGLLLHGLIAAPKIRALPAVTLPEVAGFFAGRWAEKWSGAIIAVSWIGVTAAQFLALHVLLTMLASPTVAEVLYILIAAAVLLHTALGGQSGVIRTDAVQAVLLIGGFSAAALWLFFSEPEKVAAIDWIPFNDRFGMTDWIRLMCLVGITYIVGPDMFSRSFSAKDGATARRAAWCAAPCLVWFGIVITLLAMLNLEDKQPVAGWLSEGAAMPVWLKAAIALGLISALCGTIDTVLLSASGIVERNLRGGDSTKGVRLLVTLFGIGCAAAVYVSGDIIKLLLTAYSFYVPGVAVPLFVALLGRAAPVNSRLWLAGAVLGGIAGLTGSLTGESTWTMVGIAAAAVLALLSLRR